MQEYDLSVSEEEVTCFVNKATRGLSLERIEYDTPDLQENMLLL
jgi:hypothetical protein